MIPSPDNAASQQEKDLSGSEGLTANSSNKTSATSRFLDATTLDDYLFRLLLPRLLELLFDNRTDQQDSGVSTLRWLVLPILRAVSLLYTQGQTPATSILGLNFAPKESENSGLEQSDHLLWKRPRFLTYVVVSSLLPEMFSRLSKWLEHQLESQSRQHNHSEMESLAIDRRRRVFKVAQRVIDRFVSLGRLSCLLLCWSGLTSTPNLAMVLTGFKFEHKRNQSPPKLHVDYAHRRWLHEEAMSALRVIFAGFLMTGTWFPLVHDWIHQPIARTITKLRRHVVKKQEEQNHCPICRARAIKLPFRAIPCGHKYCYTCLYEESMRTNSVQCWVCSTKIEKSKPVFEQMA